MLADAGTGYRRLRNRGDRVLIPDIVAVTTRGDISADLVVQRCNARGINIYRFNSEDYPSLVGIEVDPALPEGARLLRRDGDSIEIGHARGIWLRRPQWPVIESEVTDEGDRRLAMQESIAGIGGLWRLLRDKCVSSSDALQAARWKLPQLRLAASLGLSVPHSLVTTDSDKAASYIRRGNVVLKAVQELAVHDEGGVRSGFVQVATPADARGARVAPILLQTRVEKVADWRVSVVGRRVLAARTPMNMDGPVDVREAEGNGTTYEAQDLPDEVSTACLAYLQAVGLRFGAFDFVEDGRGEFWFLECNPNGQWGWIEAATGLPITDAIVSELMGRSR